MTLHEATRDLPDEDWFRLIRRSVSDPSCGLPGFPSEEMQAGTVGSVGESALREAEKFYRATKEHSAELSRPITASSRLLDFGCGWGRMTRYFAKDMPAERIAGVDISPKFIAACQKSGVPGDFQFIDHDDALPYPDSTFTHVIAYSVFTHLPEHVASHAIAELARVTAAGAVFVLTLEPPRFLSFVANGDAAAANTSWHRMLFAHAEAARDALARLPESGYAFLPTNGLDHYGDAVYLPTYIEEHWTGFALRSYVDAPDQFWQAIAVLQRR